jgi:hypothetical protein
MEKRRSGEMGKQSTDLNCKPAYVYINKVFIRVMG